MQANIRKYYAFKFIGFLFFFNPVLVVFFQENGLSMTEIMLLQSVFSIAIVFLEIPTGAIGDYLGWRLSIASGALLFGLCMFIYSIGTTFHVFLAAELTGGLGMALISGSDSALIYSSLKQEGREGEYSRVEGNATAFMQAGVLVASVIGGIMGSFSTRMTLAASGVSSVAAGIVALTMKEPSGGRDSAVRDSYGRIIVRSIEIVRRHRLVLWIFFYVSLVGSIAHLCQWFYQPYFKEVGIAVVHYGWLYTALGIVAIAASKMTSLIERRLGNAGSMAFLALIMVACYAGLGAVQARWAIVIFSLDQIYHGMERTIVARRVLAVVPENKSATVLSIAHLGNRLVYAVAGPVFGYLIDTIDLSFALLCLGACMAVIAAALFTAYRWVPEHFRNREHSVKA